MIRRIALSLFLASCVLPLSVLAQERVLLEPLTKIEEADARDRNQYFIRKFTFHAKRHRLVKVNTELLEVDGQIVIPLFDGEKMVADSSRIEINEATGSFKWVGRLVQDEITQEAILDDVGVVESANTIFDSLTKISIRTGFFERDEKTGANLTPVPSFQEAISPTQPNRYSQRLSNPNFVRGTSAYLRPVANPALYRLDLLGMGGPYHILYELDEERMRERNSRSDVVPTEDQIRVAESPEEKRKYERFRQENEAFEESLGENPHDVLYVERMKEKEERPE